MLYAAGENILQETDMTPRDHVGTTRGRLDSNVIFNKKSAVG